MEPGETEAPPASTVANVYGIQTVAPPPPPVDPAGDYPVPAFPSPSPDPSPAPAPVPYRFGSPVPRVGASEALVQNKARRTIEHNELGQGSLLVGIGLGIVFALAHVAHIGVITLTLVLLAALGIQFGVRGLVAAGRGLATNRGSAITGIVLASVFCVAGVIDYIVYAMHVAATIPPP